MNFNQHTNHQKISWTFIKWILAQIVPTEFALQLRSIFVIILSFAMIWLQLALPFALKQLVDSLSITNTSTTIILLCLGYGLLWIAARFVAEIREIISYRIFSNSVRQITSNFFKYLIKQPLSFHINKDMGSIIDELKRTQYTLYKGSIGFFLTILPKMVEALIALYIIWTSFPIDIALTCTLFLCAITFASIQSASSAVAAEQNANDAENNQSNFLFDHLLNIEAIQAYSQEKHELSEFSKVVGSAEISRTKALKEQYMMMLIHGGLTGLLLLLITLLTGYKVLCKTYTIGDFFLLNSYIVGFSESINQLSKHIKNIREGVVDLQGIYEIFHMLQDPKNPELATGDQTISPTDTTITFDNVSFSYLPDTPLLQSISFKIPHGKTVAIVGSSGSGKSTITKLLLRLYAPTQGSISIGNTHIDEIDLKDLRQKIGVVPQHPVLFRNTLLNNIAYAQPLAPFNKIEQAAQTASLDSFINELPAKYETELGEFGLTISGGERQRVAIARAILKDPAIFIFDEATAALDSYTESHLMRNIKSISTQKTTLIIAHRLSTIMHADNIIVLDHGRIKEQGTHEQLLELNKIYEQMWYRQESAEENE